ncbi:structural maintenance of chromosomes protein 5 [Tanacetum coccineum]
MEGAAKTLNDIREPIDKQKKEKKDHDIKCNKLRDLLDNFDTSRKQMLDKDNQLVQCFLKSKYKDVEESEKQEQSRQARISKAEKDLADAELELHNLPRYEPPKEKIEKLTTEILDLEQSAKQKRYQTKDKEKLLDRYRVSVRQGAERHEFKEVYGPVLCEVNISNAQHATYLEKQISYYMWKAFITQDFAERDYLQL